ncbi:MAG: hypothetical protein H8M99_00380 [Gloeobacteraceae cyanobacterium ES-bin-144]|nr:hypothetical protein [Verrucomicrobiales bacterium]
MNFVPGLFSYSALSLLWVSSLTAGQGTWDERMAEKFSGRLREIRGELAEIAPKIAPLPRIPLDDQGGTGGFANIYQNAKPEVSSPYVVEVNWPVAAHVDLIALVPARRYDEKGMIAGYGMPDTFTIELLDSSGNVLREVSHEKHTHEPSVRRGHPFVYQVNPPLEAAGLRISAKRLDPTPEAEGVFVQAWAEVFAFEGTRNVAYKGKVSSRGGTAPSAPWHWSLDFLVDGQTPLGLPEIPAEDHANIGWISEGRNNSNEKTSLTVDLGKVQMLDSIRLLPAKKPTSDLPSGFGFPRKISLSISTNSEPSSDPEKWQFIAEYDLRNPGHNPVEISFQAGLARFIRIDATELWKAFDSYPAFFALSEVEVLYKNNNLALGKATRSPDGMLNLIAPGGRVWTSAALSDGFGPDGRLVSTREWMIQLDRRFQLEARQQSLQTEAEQVISGWRRAGLIIFAALGLIGAFLIIVLPIRYRLKANRELIQVRERIAGDLHDEVGSNLGSIQMFADLAEGRSGPSDELKRIQRIAAETVSAVRDIVWLLRPQGEHRIGTIEHLRETSSIMLENYKWKFSANQEAWQVELPEEDTRHLFLFFREALHNIMRHATATKVEVRIEKSADDFLLTISDDGVGIEAVRLARPATLRALRQRSENLGGDFQVESHPGEGTSLKLVVPLDRKRKRKAIGFLPLIY